MTSDIKQAGSTLILVGSPNEGMAGSAYYDIANGSSNDIPLVDKESLPKVLSSVHQAIVGGKVLACHDVSEGGVISAVAEMCFGGNVGAELEPSNVSSPQMDKLLFNETAGCFVVEVENDEVAQELFGNVPYQKLGQTTADKTIEVREQDGVVFTVNTDELKDAWQAPMKGIFH